MQTSNKGRKGRHKESLRVKTTVTYTDPLDPQNKLSYFCGRAPPSLFKMSFEVRTANASRATRVRKSRATESTLTPAQLTAWSLVQACAARA